MQSDYLFWREHFCRWVWSAGFSCEVGVDLLPSLPLAGSHVQTVEVKIRTISQGEKGMAQLLSEGGVDEGKSIVEGKYDWFLK